MEAPTYVMQLQGFLMDVDEKLRFKRTRVDLLLRAIGRWGEGRDKLRSEIDELAFDIGQMESARIKLILELVLQDARGNAGDGERSCDSGSPEGSWGPTGHRCLGARGANEENRGPR